MKSGKKKSESSEFGDPTIYYQKYYSEIVGSKNSGFLGKLSNYPHLILEKPFISNKGKVILEIGSGNNEHFKFVTGDFQAYWALDKNSNCDVPDDARYHFCKADAISLPFEDSEFDRVILTCLLLHLSDPEQALLEVRRVVKQNGRVSIYLPTEPSLFLRLFRHFVTKRVSQKKGFYGYKLFIARDHVTYFSRVITLIKHIFMDSEIELKFRPFPMPMWNLNAFCIIHIHVEKSCS